MAGVIPELVGPYRVIREVGRGAMGVVYLGHDSRLGRDVALKALPPALADDQGRLARFEREARLLAALHHPNIALLYGLEEVNGSRFLVLEYVEGPTLEQRLSRGALAMDEALATGRQVAQAIEAAHAKGIVHRDLKPANIKITPGGEVKVLDFGLGKAQSDVPSDAADTIASTVTATTASTVPGVILGTLGYMSPEQAQGKPVDPRTDIWSFGCVLYECLTGVKAFGGETVAEAIGAVLHKDPDWSALPEHTPPTVRLLLRRCLARDRTRRLHDIADARLELEEAIADPTGSSLGLPSKTHSGRVERIDRSRPVQFTIRLPEGLYMPSFLSRPFAISPDGHEVVFVAGTSARDFQLYLRPMDRLEAAAVEGTRGGFDPFFSPDGRSIGFVADERQTLKRISIQGGSALPISGPRSVMGPIWGPGDTIYFQDFDQFHPRQTSGIARVPAGGGAPARVTTPDPDSGDCHHRFPEILPDRQTLLFSTLPDQSFNVSRARLEAQHLGTGQRKSLLEGVMLARYCPTGHLIFARENTLVAAPFDVERLQLTGAEQVVLQVHLSASGAANFAVSRTGTLLYVPAPESKERRSLIHLVDAQGRLDRKLAPVGAFAEPRLSPDGRRVALTRRTREGGWNVWVLDLDRETCSRLTYGERDSVPIWAPDGSRIAFVSGTRSAGARDLYCVAADGSSEPQLLLQTETPSFPNSFTPDGSALAYTALDREASPRLYVLPLVGKAEPRPLFATLLREFGAEFSPDGRWVAYTSEESGEMQVYVRPFHGPGRKWQISTSGGTSPAWSRDGRRLFYRIGDAVMSVEITTGDGFTASAPRVLFEGRFEEYGTAWDSRNYDVTPDGQRFVVIVAEDPTGPTEIGVVLNWFETLKDRFRRSR